MKNREIKFRAWDKKYNVMLCTGFNIIGEVSLFSGVDVMLMEQSKKHNDDTPSILRLNDVCIMQFTGLEDKKDVDIYEGDIVRVGGAGLGEIKWHELDCQFKTVWHDRHFKRIRGNNPERYSGGESIFRNHKITFEVIGNIYSNPELLTTP